MVQLNPLYFDLSTHLGRPQHDRLDKELRDILDFTDS